MSELDYKPISKIQIKRGASTAGVMLHTPSDGEPVWDKEANTLRMGDGVTPGGVLIGFDDSGLQHDIASTTGMAPNHIFPGDVLENMSIFCDPGAPGRGLARYIKFTDIANYSKAHWINEHAQPKYTIPYSDNTVMMIDGTNVINLDLIDSTGTYQGTFDQTGYKVKYLDYNDSTIRSDISGNTKHYGLVVHWDSGAPKLEFRKLSGVNGVIDFSGISHNLEDHVATAARYVPYSNSSSVITKATYSTPYTYLRVANSGNTLEWSKLRFWDNTGLFNVPYYSSTDTGTFTSNDLRIRYKDNMGRILMKSVDTSASTDSSTYNEFVPFFGARFYFGDPGSLNSTVPRMKFNADERAGIVIFNLFGVPQVSTIGAAKGTYADHSLTRWNLIKQYESADASTGLASNLANLMIEPDLQLNYSSSSMLKISPYEENLYTEYNNVDFNIDKVKCFGAIRTEGIQASWNYFYSRGGEFRLGVWGAYGDGNNRISDNKLVLQVLPVNGTENPSSSARDFIIYNKNILQDTHHKNTISPEYMYTATTQISSGGYAAETPDFMFSKYGTLYVNGCNYDQASATVNFGSDAKPKICVGASSILYHPSVLYSGVGVDLKVTTDRYSALGVSIAKVSRSVINADACSGSCIGFKIGDLTHKHALSGTNPLTTTTLANSYTFGIYIEDTNSCANTDMIRFETITSHGPSNRLFSCGSFIADNTNITLVGTFTANAGTDILTGSWADVQGEERVQISNSGGSLPGGLVANTFYYVIKLSNTQLKLALTYEDAQNDIPINITTNGSGTNSLHNFTGEANIIGINFKNFEARSWCAGININGLTAHRKRCTGIYVSNIRSDGNYDAYGMVIGHLTATGDDNVAAEIGLLITDATNLWVSDTTSSVLGDPQPTRGSGILPLKFAFVVDTTDAGNTYIASERTILRNLPVSAGTPPAGIMMGQLWVDSADNYVVKYSNAGDEAYS